MPCYSEPTHNLGPRTTIDSNKEGRLKVGISRKNKRRILKKIINKKKYEQQKK